MALPPFHPNDFTLIDACAGFGMLGEAVLLGLEHLGLRGRVACHIERDSAAAAALVARMEASPLDRAPVYSDLATFNGRRWRGLVDGFIAGLPCQPYSPAGKRIGNTDHRSFGEDGDGPVGHVLRIIGECQPAVVWLENVPAWVVGGHFRSVGDELCRMGYAIEDPIFVAAADVGAPHERERVFILAHQFGQSDGYRFTGARSLSRRAARTSRSNDSMAVGQRDGRSSDVGVARTGRQPEPAHCGIGVSAGVGLADASGTGLQGSECRRASEDARASARRSIAQRDRELGDSHNTRQPTPRGRQQEQSSGRRGVPDVGCDRLPLFPPGRGDEHNPDHRDWRAWAAVAAVDPARMPRTQSRVSVVVDGMARADELRIGGNGVVPVAAAVAFVTQFSAVLRREGF